MFNLLAKSNSIIFPSKRKFNKRPQFSMVYTLIDHRNDVIECSKLKCGEWFHCKVLNIIILMLITVLGLLVLRPSIPSLLQSATSVITKCDRYTKSMQVKCRLENDVEDIEFGVDVIANKK